MRTSCYESATTCSFRDAVLSKRPHFYALICVPGQLARQAAGRQEEGEAGVVCVLREHGQAEREEVNRDIPGAVWLNRALETCWNASLSTLSTKSCYCEGRASIIGLSWLDGRYCPIYQITFTFKQTVIPYHHWM